MRVLRWYEAPRSVETKAKTSLEKMA